MDTTILNSKPTLFSQNFLSFVLFLFEVEVFNRDQNRQKYANLNVYFQKKSHCSPIKNLKKFIDSKIKICC